MTGVGMEPWQPMPAPPKTLPVQCVNGCANSLVWSGWFRSGHRAKAIPRYLCTLCDGVNYGRPVEMKDHG